MELKDLIHKSADWRGSIRANTRRTYFVIGSFVLIYAGLGLLIDVYLNAQKYPEVSLSRITSGLLHFEIFPSATLILALIAVVAILITFSLHNKLMLLGTEYHEVDPKTAETREEVQLYNVIEEMKVAAGLSYMPKVFIIDADYMNAFASGYSEKSAMMAITRGLLMKLNRAELQAVMAHELSHIRHLDIKVTLMAAVLSNITLIVLDFFFRGMLFSNGRDREDRGRGILFIIVIALRILLPLITILLIFYLSRSREYMADAGSVELTRDNQPLASALLKIYNDHLDHNEQYSADYQNTPNESVRREAYIFDPSQAGISNLQSLSDLFSTHPTIEKRLAALGFKVPPTKPKN
jgi:heat shock protein HtpX